MTKLDINRKMIGKPVFVRVSATVWISGVVEDVIDEETFRVELENKRKEKVNIFDIRAA